MLNKVKAFFKGVCKTIIKSKMKQAEAYIRRHSNTVAHAYLSQASDHADLERRIKELQLRGLM